MNEAKRTKNKEYYKDYKFQLINLDMITRYLKCTSKE